MFAPWVSSIVPGVGRDAAATNRCDCMRPRLFRERPAPRNRRMRANYWGVFELIATGGVMIGFGRS
jgi:hypothetical protein